ncbi:MAG: DUF3105 domain-containing protein [Nitriliruptor sp.]
MAAVVVLVVGFGAGAVLGQLDPPRAARLVVAEFTTTEDGPADAPGPDPQLPVTGPQRGVPTCGWIEGPLGPAEQVATLAAGVVLIQHAGDPTQAEGARLRDLADRDRVAVAPSPALPDGARVVATSWRRRMPLERVDAGLLDAFVTGHADRAPALAPCP